MADNARLFVKSPAKPSNVSPTKPSTATQQLSPVHTTNTYANNAHTNGYANSPPIKTKHTTGRSNYFDVESDTSNSDRGSPTPMIPTKPKTAKPTTSSKRKSGLRQTTTASYSNGNDNPTFSTKNYTDETTTETTAEKTKELYANSKLFSILESEPWETDGLDM